MKEHSSSRVFGLDMLRTLAIAGVVLAHGGLTAVLSALAGAIPGVADHSSWAFFPAQAGAMGVELFFVLSGFLIGGILLRTGEGIAQPRGLGTFWIRRWFRTLPLFVVALLANVGFERWFHGRTLSVQEIVEHGLFLRNFAHISLSFFPESWSLAIEEWFYLLFPALLCVLARLSPGRFTRAFLASAVVFFVFSTGLRAWSAAQPGAEWSMAQRCTVILRFDALMAGVFAAWIAQTYPNAWRRRAVASAWLGSVLFFVSYATFWRYSSSGIEPANDSYFARSFRFNLFSLSFALLLPLASRWRPEREGALHRMVRDIALWSYALYLAHWPVFQALSHPRFAAWQQGPLAITLFYVAKLALVTALAAFLHRCVERPALTLRDRLSPERKAA